MARYLLTAIIDVEDSEPDDMDDGVVQPPEFKVKQEFEVALVKWQDDLGDVYFTIEVFDLERLEG
jgi:hypothetical protein